MAGVLQSDGVQFAKGYPEALVLMSGSCAQPAVEAKASLDMSTITVTPITTVLEAHVGGVGGNAISVAAVGDATGVKAHLHLGALCTNLDSLLEFATAGVGGNAWKVVIEPGSGGAEGVNVYEDTVNKILTVQYETAVSTVTNFETAIGTTVNFTATGGTGASVLAAATDKVPPTSLASGTENQYLVVTPTTLVIHYNPTVTTAGDIETLITALAGADDIVDVKTGGANTYAAGDAFPATALAGGTSNTIATSSVEGLGLTVARTGTGEVTFTFQDAFAELIASEIVLNLGTAEDQLMMAGDYSSAAKTLKAAIWDISGAAVADPALNTGDKINYAFLWRNASF